MKVIVLYGGVSAEHDISILSAYNIIQSIDRDRYQVQPVYITRDNRWLKGALVQGPLGDPQQLRLQEAVVESWGHPDGEPSTGQVLQPGDLLGPDRVVFPVLHGPNGEDGKIQGFLETLDLPYVGAGVMASALGMDKMASKILFSQAGIPQVPYVAFTRLDWERDREALVQKCEGSLLYPFFVKPANMGSSVGISKVTHRDQLEAAVEAALLYDRRIVVEQGIEAEECEVSVLGNVDVSASVVGRLVKEQAFYDYEEKYINNTVSMEIPAQLPESVAQTLRDLAIQAYRIIDACGLSRVDFFVTQYGDIYLNEINTMPGFTEFSMYTRLWEETGLSQRDLVEELIQLAIKRHDTKLGLRPYAVQGEEDR